MANSVATLSRILHRSLLSNPKVSHFSMPFCTEVSSSGHKSDLDDPDHSESGSLADLPEPPSSQASSGQQGFNSQPLENGLDLGIYKAILVGQVGQAPLQKKLRSGRTVTLMSVGTGGIRNNRRPLENEEPRDYANRCAVQWHRVSIYPERLAGIAMKHAVPGSIIYLEGNLETKIFSDPITGLVRRVREVAIRRNGRLVFLGNSDNARQQASEDLRKVGYY